MNEPGEGSARARPSTASPEGLDRPQLERQLELLTREILRLKGLLRAQPEPLPRADYDALAVEIATDWYAIPIDAIIEVLEFVWPDPLPDTAPWILGSIYYTDEQVPVVDVRRRLLDVATPWSLSAKLVLAHHGSLRALMVDSVGDLLRVPAERVTRPPDDIPQSPFLLGSLRPEAGRTVHLLSLERTCRELASPG